MLFALVRSEYGQQLAVKVSGLIGRFLLLLILHFCGTQLLHTVRCLLGRTIEE